MIARPSSRFTASGFSTITCTPARAAAMACSAWHALGELTQTTSTSGSSASTRSVASASPCSAAKRAACSRRLDQTATGRASGTCWKAAM